MIFVESIICSKFIVKYITRVKPTNMTCLIPKYKTEFGKRNTVSMLGIKLAI